MNAMYLMTDITHEQAEPFRAAHLAKLVHHCLQAQKIVCGKLKQGTEDFDAEIKLGGDFKSDRSHTVVQIGDGYFSVVVTEYDKEGEMSAWHFHDSDFHKSLSAALAAARSTKEGLSNA